MRGRLAVDNVLGARSAGVTPPAARSTSARPTAAQHARHASSKSAEAPHLNSHPRGAKTSPLAQLGLADNAPIALLKALHILTPEGAINQDSRRKLKQVNHLVQFIAPLLDESYARAPDPVVVDHGAGKSYLGFMLYERCMRMREAGRVIGVETRAELVARSRELAEASGFQRMAFMAMSVDEALAAPALPAQVDIVTALHACDTATDDAIHFALAKQAKHIALVPCCQAEVARFLRAGKPGGKGLPENAQSNVVSEASPENAHSMGISEASPENAQSMGISLASALSELWRRPLHTREFGSQITNVLRGLQLEAAGYQVTVTELVGWEHSMKNELILATRSDTLGETTSQSLSQNRSRRKHARQRLTTLLDTLPLGGVKARFMRGIDAS
jgi:hypothetical protein